jgi:hypothetical protein
MSLTQAQINALLGPVVSRQQQPYTPPTNTSGVRSWGATIATPQQTSKVAAPASTSERLTPAAEAPYDPRNPYANALTRERTRINSEVARWEQEWDAKYDNDLKVMQNELETASTNFTRLRGAREQKISNAKALNSSQGLNFPDSYYDEQFPPSEEEQTAAASLWTLPGKISTMTQGHDANRKKARDEFRAPMEDRYNRAMGTVSNLAANVDEQKRLDREYEEARAAYNNAVTQHDKDYAAFKMWEAKKAMYDQDSKDRQADIDAGRYAVNPYQFMAQGAGINEIDELRKQVNAGNLRPNMRVPDALVAPEEVKDPGQFQGAAPTRQYVEAPKIDEDVATLIGYTKPNQTTVSTEIAKPSSEPVDTSSVTSGYESPAEKEEKPKPETDASGNPVVAQPTGAQPTGAGTLQQTSNATTSPTQQTATQAATPAPALPAQPTGSVAGQGSNTGQTPETQTPPKTEEKPAPFIADEEEKDKQDSVF